MQTTIDADVLDRPSFTIAQFCAHYGVSRQHYYELKRRGIAPDELKLGRAVRITDQARRDWEATMRRASNPATQPHTPETVAPIKRTRA